MLPRKKKVSLTVSARVSPRVKHIIRSETLGETVGETLSETIDEILTVTSSEISGNFWTFGTFGETFGKALGDSWQYFERDFKRNFS